MEKELSDNRDPFGSCILYLGKNILCKARIPIFFFQLFLFPCSRTPSRDLYFMYNIWQDAGIQTPVAATAARCAPNELHTSIFSWPVGYHRLDSTLLQGLHCIKPLQGQPSWWDRGDQHHPNTLVHPLVQGLQDRAPQFCLLSCRTTTELYPSN